MSMVINNNLAALTTYDTVNATSKALENSIKKLSTGLRINSAADDAAGLAISEKMRAQISGLDQAVKNAQDGISLIQTAEGALSQTHSILQRMRELSVQAANDTLTAQDRSYIQEEINQLTEEIDHIGNTTTFNTKNLLNGDAAVLWSSSDLNTKAIINGGLRTVDQFGQKSSAEGNYKISIKAKAGTNEVQKTDIFRIKHNLDSYQVEGSNKLEGAAVVGSASPDFDAVGSRTIKLTLTDAANSGNTGTITITLNSAVKNTEGLKDAISEALTLAKSGDLSSTPQYTASGHKVANSGDLSAVTWLDIAAGLTTDSDGNEVLALTSSKGNLIKVEGDATSNAATTPTAAKALSDVLGLDSSATTTVQKSTATITLSDTAENLINGKAAAATMLAVTLNTNGTDNATTNVTITAGAFDVDGSGNFENVTDAKIQTALTAALATAFGADGDGNAYVTATVSGSTITLTSTNGALHGVGGGAAGLIQAGQVSDVAYTSEFTVNSDEDLQKFDFGHEVAGASVDIYDGSDTLGTKLGTITVSSSVKDIDTLIADLNTQIETVGFDDKVVARKVEDDDGNEVVRLFSNTGKDLTIVDAGSALDSDGLVTTAPTTNKEGSAIALFGGSLAFDSATTRTKIASSATTGTYSTSAGEIEDTLPLMDEDDTYAFEVQDTDGNTLASLKIEGPITADVDATTKEVIKTAAKKLAEEINTQLENQNLTNIYATVNDDGGVSFKSATREFKLVDTSGTNAKGNTYKGYADLLGTGTDGASKAVSDDSVNTIGEVATSTTKLRDIEKFWDSQGNYMITDPQTLTITQGDGKSTSVTVYEYDTIGDVVDKLNTAIGETLGQAKFTDEEGAKHFVTFVDSALDTPKAGSGDNVTESVAGTMIIRSVLPGTSGALTISSNNENFYNAFSLNTIQTATESEYYVTVQDAHTGEVVNGIQDEKITGNVLKSRLHENVDVEFNPLTGISATWNDDNKSFTLAGAYDNGGDADVTYLHLSDNTMVFQIGANEGDDMSVNIGDMRAHALGVDNILVTDRESAGRAITQIDNAIDRVSTQRAKLGAYQNRLEYTSSNLTTASENLTAAESRIRDTDMASEMMNFTKLQIMLQAGTSMLAQANQLPQNVLSLIR